MEKTCWYLITDPTITAVIVKTRTRGRIQIVGVTRSDGTFAEHTRDEFLKTYTAFPPKG